MAIALAMTLFPASDAAAQTQSLSIDQGAQSMTGVQDVLGNQKYLLQDQDLQLLQVSLQGNGSLSTQTSDLFTGNSAVNSQAVDQSFSQSTAPGTFNFSSGVLASEASGKMFNTTNDTVAIIAPVETYFRLTFLDNRSGWNTAVSLTNNFQPGGTVNVQVAMGNFTGTGYAATLAYYSSSTSINWGMRVVAAADPNNEDALVTMGPEYIQANLLRPNPNAIAVGDFNNDGRDEIAILMNDDETIAFYAVDPNSLTITQTGTYVLPSAYTLTGNVTMVAGRFRDCGSNCQTNADLAIVGALFTANTNLLNIVSVIPVQITPQSNGTID